MSGPSKRQRTYNFNTDWEESYCFVNLKNKCVCLLCGSSIAVPKKHNVERHFQTNHGTFNVNYPLKSEVRKKKMCNLKSSLTAQQTVFTRHVENSKKATIASFKISHMLAKKKKPFIDGELFKELFLTGADCLFDGFSNKREIVSAIQDLQLSNNTVTRRIHAISTDIQTQLKTDLEICDWFSLQFDESTDISDTAQLAVMVRMVFSNFTVKEDMLQILPMKGQTRGEDIYNTFKTYAKSINMPLHKLSAITTDGAPAMMGKNKGFIALCMKDDSFSNFMSYHCIIHQEALCCKILPFEHVMKIVTKIINSIRAAPLQHRLFKALLEDTEDKEHDLILHTEVRWLSKGKVLTRFVSLIEEIKTFINDRKENYDELADSGWLIDLGFLTDIMEKLNSLNLELQGKDKSIAEMISSVKSFKAKLDLLISHLQINSLVHFPHMKKMLGDNELNGTLFIKHLQELKKQFEERFLQFKHIEPIVSFCINPFTCQINVMEIAACIADFVQGKTEELELEILDLKNDILLKSLMSEDFWNTVDREKFPLLKKAAYKIESFFGSTYLCESLFSNMNLIKSRYRSRLTDEHLYDCLLTGLSSYAPNYEALANEMQCQRSH